MALYNKRKNIYIQYVIYHTIQQNTIQEKKEKNHLGSLVKAT